MVGKFLQKNSDEFLLLVCLINWIVRLFKGSTPQRRVLISEQQMNKVVNNSESAY